MARVYSYCRQRSFIGNMRTGVEPEREPVSGYDKRHDEGCDLFPLCLECPLSRCRYDFTKVAKDRIPSAKRIAKRQRNEEISALRVNGVSIRDLARGFGVSRHTICRIIRHEREGNAPHTNRAQGTN